MTRSNLPRTDWYNAKAQPPVRTGWYEFRRHSQDGCDRFYYDAIGDVWRNFPTENDHRASPSVVLGHCEWRGIYLGGKK